MRISRFWEEDNQGFERCTPFGLSTAELCRRIALRRDGGLGCPQAQGPRDGNRWATMKEMLMTAGLARLANYNFSAPKDNSKMNAPRETLMIARTASLSIPGPLAHGDAGWGVDRSVHQIRRLPGIWLSY